MKSSSQKPPKDEIVPVGFVCKVKPPQIGLVYHMKAKGDKKRVYLISLNGLEALGDPVLITEQLFMEHALVLKKETVNPIQVSFCLFYSFLTFSVFLPSLFFGDAGTFSFGSFREFFPCFLLESLNGLLNLVLAPFKSPITPK